MEKIKVDVSTYANDRNKYYATTTGGRFSLIKFEWTGFNWYFYIGEALGHYGGAGGGMTISGENGFPLDYFNRVCQSVWLLQGKNVEFPEIELTARAKKLLKIK